MKRIIAAALVILVASPTSALAHLGDGNPSSDQKVYDVVVSIEGLSIVDDLNAFFVGPADVLFDYEVDPNDPQHEKVQGLTTDPVSISDNQTKSFSPKKIYQHQTCGCEQDFEINIKALDHSPKQFLALDAFIEGVDLGESFVFGGTAGLTIAVVGKAVNYGFNFVQRMSLTDDQKKALIEDEMRQESEHLGTMSDTPSTTCEKLQESFTSPLLLEERENGSITYKVTKTATNKLCGGEESQTPGSAVPSGSPTGVTSSPTPTGSAAAPTNLPQPTPTAKPACIASTGKVLVDDQYYCPTSSVEAGEACECLPNYEWVNKSNLCLGCTKTKKDACMAATKKAIDMATGNLEPSLSFVADKQIKWDLGEVSCKAADAVITDYSRDLNTYIPQVNQECTNLKLVSGVKSNACELEFLFEY